jgi:outer membrane protein TolC
MQLKFKFQKLLVASFILATGGLVGNAQTLFDLNGSIAYALKHNYNYQKQELDRAITYEKTNEVLSMGFPKINGSIGYRNNFQLPTSILPGEIVGRPGTTVPVQFGTSNNADVGFTLQQLIFDGRYLVGVQARKAIKSLADVQLKISEQGVKELISKSFYQVLALDESIKMLEENQTVLNKLLDDTRKTYKQGLIEELDVERLEYNVLNLDKMVVNTKNQRELAINAFKFNLGFPMDSNLNVMGSLAQEADKYKVIPTAFDLSQKPELKMLQENVNIKNYDLKQNRAGYLPSLYGSAAYGWQAQRQSFDFFKGGDWFNYGNFGIQLSVPIFDGLTKKYQVGQANLAYKKAKFELIEYEQASKIQAVQSVLSLQNALNDLDYQNNILKLSAKIQNKTQIKYKEGIGSSFEFAQAQGERIQQQIKVIQALQNVATKGVEWSKAIGKL